ncbi:hypothetical protein SPSYN_00934 [Sporotomaculum syntrophicum]|uniref:Uncharacterized protein n=1 Tax=Sporotomaculum syntrophicum TaxID=182264 RepID=A0A9D2WSB9_9FIRM|nr:hypothetical protein SPSYN_00934 [Sporotomaculum syntrophicum]
MNFIRISKRVDSRRFVAGALLLITALFFYVNVVTLSYTKYHLGAGTTSFSPKILDIEGLLTLSYHAFIVIQMSNK